MILNSDLLVTSYESTRCILALGVFLGFAIGFLLASLIYEGSKR